jgi:HK97 family phage portal protein
MPSLSHKIKTAFSYWKTGKKSVAWDALFSDFYESGNSASFTGFGLGRSGRDVVAENNSAVMACLGWGLRNFRHGRLEITKQRRKQKEALPAHRALSLLNKPNPYYSSKLLWNGIYLSFHLDGNGYLLLTRNRNGRGIPVAVTWVPHWAMRPYYVPGVSPWIDFYEYSFEGKYAQIPVENVIHFRNGIDLQNPRLGRAPFKSALEEVLTDEEAARMTAALMGNMGLPGVVIAPDDATISIAPEDRRDIKEEFDRNYGGTNRGKTLVLSDKTKVTTLGFSLKDLEIGTVRHVPEQRIGGTLGIPLEVVGLGSGKEASTYNNLKTFERQAFDQHLIPTFDDFAEELNNQFLPNFEEDPTVKFEFNRDKIPALQEVVDAEHKRAREDYGADLCTLNEARAVAGFEPREDGDVFRVERQTVVKPQPAPISTKSLKKEPGDIAGEDNGLMDDLEHDLRAAQSDFTRRLSLAFKSLADEVSDVNLTEHGFFLETDLEQAARSIASEIVDNRVSVFIDAFELTHAKIEKAVSDYVAKELNKAVDLPSTLIEFNKARIENFTANLREQTLSAARRAHQLMDQGLSRDEIFKELSEFVSGKEIYPNVYKKALQSALDNGLTQETAEVLAETTAREFRARCIAETEIRESANFQFLEAASTAGVERVKVADGADCGWTYHNDPRRAHNLVVPVAEAKQYRIAHPRCQRRFLPIKNDEQ